MSNAVLIIGESGAGKSTSIRTLDPKTTFIINVLDKPLPFRGYKHQYTSIENGNHKTGNYYASNRWDKVVACINHVSQKRSDITTLVLDDWQYILASELMERCDEKGYDKFTQLANHGWSTIDACLKARSDLTCFILAHSDLGNSGRAKCKTIGKMLDEKITIEGLFTTVLHSRVIDNDYLFQTQSDSDYLAKSPMGLFDSILVPNDLQAIKEKIEDYFNDDSVNESATREHVA